MSAQEMFEKLDYHDNGNRMCKCEIYVYENTETRSIGNEFYQQGISIIIEVDSTVIKQEDNGKILPITYLEIQAIHQQMKELGWL